MYDGVDRRKHAKGVCQEHSGMCAMFESIDARLKNIEARTECLSALVEKGSTNRNWLYGITITVIALFIWILKKTL